MPAGAGGGGQQQRQRGRAACAATKKRTALDGQIEEMKQAQLTLKKQRGEVRKTMRNAQRRRSRIKRKAQQLSTADLMEIMQMRELQARHA